MKQIIPYWTIILLLYSCGPSTNKELIVDYKYIGNEGYSPDKVPDLRCDTLFLVFASNFDKDTIRIKYGLINKTRIYSTDQVTGHAGDIIVGRIRKNNELKLRINNYNPVIIKVDKENQFFLIELQDSVLHVSSKYHFDGFM